MPCLGFSIRSDSSHAKDLSTLTGKMWAAFWRQRAKNGHRISKPLQLANLGRTVAGILRFYVSAIAPAAGLLKRLDSIQRKMCSIVVGWTTCGEHGIKEGLPSIAIAAHWRRVASYIEWFGGSWSARWTLQHRTWIDHLLRHPDLPAAAALFAAVDHHEWLHLRRTEQMLRKSCSSLVTRRAPGWPLRWIDPDDSTYISSTLTRPSTSLAQLSPPNSPPR
jgi:hypothetical protein